MISILCNHCKQFNSIYITVEDVVGRTFRCSNCGQFTHVLQIEPHEQTISPEVSGMFAQLERALNGESQRGVPLDNIKEHRGQKPTPIEFPFAGAIPCSMGGVLCDPPPNPVHADSILRSGADTYAARNALYGDSYKTFGKVMEAIMPADYQPNSVAGWNRLGIFTMLVSKITRYAANMPDGGHADSAHDMMVYAAMLEELTNQQGEH
jgi:hypothetical protein